MEDIQMDNKNMLAIKEIQIKNHKLPIWEGIGAPGILIPLLLGV